MRHEMKWFKGKFGADLLLSDHITGNLLVVTNKPLVELTHRLIHSNGHLCQIGSVSHWLTGGLKTKMPIILK